MAYLDKWQNITVKEFQELQDSLPFIPVNKEDVARHEYKGYLFSKDIRPETLDALKTWEVRNDDVFIVTFPKAGTTWMQEIVSIILADGNFDAIKDKHVFSRAPYLERTPVKHISQLRLCPPSYMAINNMPSPRLIKTHLAATLLPNQMFEKKPRIIYLTRNPKDLIVSYYFFTKYIPTMQKYETLQGCIDDFYIGKGGNGNWFTENLFWWSKRAEPNVLHIKYEEMKKDLKTIVTKICGFLEKSLSDSIIEQIVGHSSFEKMKANPMSNPDSLKFYDPKVEGKISFMRKGQVGDWKNHFTVSQNRTFDELCETKLKGSGLTFDFTI